MNEQQVWELITQGSDINGEPYSIAGTTWDDIIRSYSSKLAGISEKLSVQELTELIGIGMAVHHKSTAS